ncbi:MAG TPA: IS630 family transposase [Nitrososphaera sp.]|nr:IS630 family transposase [Nitrososphaera sp.]
MGFPIFCGRRGGAPADQKKARVNYSERYVAKLLRRWGFTPQKPAFRAYEQSPRALRQWLERDYPAIRRRAAQQGAAVLWLDEVGMRSQHQAGTTYAAKGKTPVLPRTGKRFSVHMISAISNRGQLVFMVVDAPFNAVVFIRFLQKLLRSVRRKVFLIADRHPVHGERKVEQWLQEHKARIAFFPLPTYSPEINPDEYFNQDLKTNGVGKARPTNKQELKTLAERFANGKKKNPEKLKKYFHPNEVAYAR